MNFLHPTSSRGDLRRFRQRKKADRPCSHASPAASSSPWLVASSSPGTAKWPGPRSCSDSTRHDTTEAWKLFSPDTYWQAPASWPREAKVQVFQTDQLARVSNRDRGKGHFRVKSDRRKGGEEWTGKGKNEVFVWLVVGVGWNNPCLFMEHGQS